MPRSIYLLGLGLVLIGLALAVTDWVKGPAPGITEANVRRIRPGMTLEEVEAILGRECYWAASAGGTITNWFIDYEWFGVDGVASVRFVSLPRRNSVVGSVQFRRDPESKAKSAAFRSVLSPTPLQRLRAWLGL
jgi:hypothetical protein